jgi:geranylgeranyl reductase family protein
MPFNFDTLIVGAGPAGCSAAYDLAHAGQRVLLLDRRSFPRPKACACGLTRKTLAALRYPVTPIVERECPEIVLQTGNGFTNIPPTSLPMANKSKEVRVTTKTPIAAMAVRSRFDAFCLDQTLASGRNGGSATLLKIETIISLTELPDHIELTVAIADGPRTFTAPVLIGADGSNGQTRRLEHSLRHSGEALPPSAQDPSWYTHGFALEATVPYAALPTSLPAGDAPQDLVFDFAPLPGGYGWLFPKGDHINIGVGAFAPSSSTSPTDLKAVTRQLLLDYTHQKLGLRNLPSGEPLHITGQALGMGGHDYIPSGRVLLTGDAAGLVDPLTGEGIHSAIVSGQAAAAAILETLTIPGAPPSPTASSSARVGSQDAGALSQAYARHLRPLQQTLAFSHRAARSFYANPDRGFRAMRNPILRPLILKTYADGLPRTGWITTLAKLFT